MKIDRMDIFNNSTLAFNMLKAMSNEANALDMVDTDLMRVLANIRKTMAAVCSQGKKNAAILITKAGLTGF